MAKVIRQKHKNWTRFLLVLLATWAMAASNAEAQFPTVVATNSTSETTSGVDPVVTLPAGIASGDLIIAFVAHDLNATATWPGPWVEIVDQSNGTTPGLHVAYLIASGGETTVTVTMSAAARSQHLAIRISAASWHGTTPPEVAAAVTGISANPNSGSLTPSWGSEDTLWITTFGQDDPAVRFPVTGWPTNYTDNNLSNGTGDASTAGIALATRELATATEDPGAFTTTGSDGFVASTIAVRPAAASPDLQQLHYRWRNDDGGEFGVWYDNNYSYRKKLTIDNTLVSGAADLGNFPILVSYTDADLKHMGEAVPGKVENIDGYDVIFTNDTHSTKLDHEIESYTASTGQIVLWVRIPTLSFNPDTDIYIYYGNSSIAASQENVPGVWDTNHVAVWHLNEAGADEAITGTHFDSASPPQNGAQNGNAATAGKISGGQGFDTNDSVDMGDQPEFELLSAYSYSTWIRGNSAPGSTSNEQPLYNADQQFQFNWSHSGAAFQQAAVHKDSVAWQPAQIATPLLGATWYYVAATYDGSNIRVYLNGLLEDTQAAAIPVPAAGALTIGDTNSTTWSGQFDEFRISDIARNADWIKTEFDNQNNQGTGVGKFIKPPGPEETPSTGATWAAAEDTELTGLDKLTTKRVRIEISNEGTASSGSILYRLEVSQDNPTTCDAGGNTWTRIDTSTHWNMVASTYFADADLTTNIDPGLFDENTNFLAGELKEDDVGIDDQTLGIILSTTQFTEIEYAVQATASATDGATYCFRLTDAGTATDFTYTETKYAKVTLANPSAAISSTNPASLTESNLNTATVTVTLTDGTYNASLVTGDFSLNGAPAGTTISGVVRDSATQATLTLAFDLTDFDTNASMSVTVATTALVSGGPLTTGTVTVTAVIEAPDLQQLHYLWRNDDGGEGVGAWYNSAWNYRKKITVDFTKVDANQNDFPVYVNLADLGANFFASVESAGGNDGGDIRVTNSDGITELPREIVTINVGTQTGELHFEADFLSSSVPTDFYIYYGNAAASEPLRSSIYGKDKVWENGYVGVWHLEESPANATAGHDDSTGNPNDGTPQNFGGAGSTTNATGKIGGADDLDGVDDYVNVGSDVLLDDLGPLTVSAWIKPDAYGASGAPSIATKRDPAATTGRWLFEIDNTAPEADSLAFAKDHVTTGLDVASDVSVVQIAPPAWQHVVATWDGSINVSGVHLYVNGGETLYGATQAGVGAPNSDAAWDLSFGAKTDGTNALHAGMDEIRVSSTPRLASWIKTEFNNQDNPGVGGFLAAIESQETHSADEDTPLTGLAKLTTKRVRIEISNEGTASSGSVLYRLEVSQANPGTCDAGGNTWTRIDTSTHWNMVASTYYADADPTTNINPGLTDENTTFVAGEMKEDGVGIDDETLGIVLSTTQFTEIEYAIQATASATDSATYCFRLTDAGTATGFTYTETRYAKVTLANPSAAISSTNPASLTESNLNTATVTVTLTDGTYNASLVTGDFSLNGAPTGTTISGVVRDSATQATLTLSFDLTDFDTNASMSVTVATTALVSGGPLTTGTVTVTAVVESADLQQLHYRWRNDDGGEGDPPAFDTGTGADLALAPTGTFNLNTNLTGSRSYADGIAYRVVAPADAASSVTRFNGADTLSNGIAAGDEVLLIHMQGAAGDFADKGNYEFLEVQSVSASTITFTTSTTKSYDGTTASNQKVVVQRVPNYTSVTLDSTDSLTASAWDGLVTTPTGTAGYLTGIVVFRATGTVDVGAGTSIDVDGLGYQGGAGGIGNVNDGVTADGGDNGESYDGKVGSGGDDTTTGGTGESAGTSGGGSSSGWAGALTTGLRGGGGGGGNTDISGLNDGAGGGAGGGYGGGGTAGDGAPGGAGGDGGSAALTAGVNNPTPALAGIGDNTGQGGISQCPTCGGTGAGGGGGGGHYGAADLGTIFLGSGGGGGGAHDNGPLAGQAGGDGGGIIIIIANSVSNSGTVSSNGANGVATANRSGASGGGSGGSILVQANSFTNSATFTATGGTGGAASTFTTDPGPGGGGGSGGVGRNRIEADTITAPPARLRQKALLLVQEPVPPGQRRQKTPH